MSDQRTVLITGCSSGFGLGMVQAFQARGWKVIAGLRDLERAPGELADATLIRIDMENDAHIHAAAAGITRLDCLINNAGYALTGPLVSYTPEQMRRQLQVNVLGPALLTQQLLPALKRSRGRIINISSIMGETGMPMNALYSASKHALKGLSESLRYELAPFGVQVALVEPGGFRTRFGKNMEWGSRDDKADAAIDVGIDAGIDAGIADIERDQLAGYRAMREQMLAGTGRDPAPVIAAVIKLAKMTSMPLHTRVGSDTRLLHNIRRWLPENMAINLIGTAFRKHMSGKEK